MVRDVEGTNYIIELDRKETTNFVAKSFFNTAKLASECVERGDKIHITKIFHLSILFFPHDSSQVPNGPIYHVKNSITNIMSDGTLGTHYTHKDYKKGNNTEQSSIDYAKDINAMPEYMLSDVPNQFPEYIYVSIPQYRDSIDTALGQWLYLLKYSKIEKNFRAKAIQKTSHRLQKLNMSKEEKALYVCQVAPDSSKALPKLTRLSLGSGDLALALRILILHPLPYSKSLTMVRCAAMLADRGQMYRRAVTYIRFPSIARVSTSELMHVAISICFG